MLGSLVVMFNVPASGYAPSGENTIPMVQLAPALSIAGQTWSKRNCDESPVVIESVIGPTATVAVPTLSRVTTCLALRPRRTLPKLMPVVEIVTWAAEKTEAVNR